MPRRHPHDTHTGLDMHTLHCHGIVGNFSQLFPNWCLTLYPFRAKTRFLWSFSTLVVPPPLRRLSGANADVSNTLTGFLTCPQVLRLASYGIEGDKKMAAKHRDSRARIRQRLAGGASAQSLL